MNNFHSEKLYESAKSAFNLLYRIRKISRVYMHIQCG